MADPQMFISCSSDSTDRANVVDPILRLIRSTSDIEPVLHDETPQRGILADTVKESIKECPLFLAIATDYGGGITKPWILTEIAFALGLSPPKDVIIFRDRKVDLASLTLAGDHRNVTFDTDSSGKLVFDAAVDMVSTLDTAGIMGPPCASITVETPIKNSPGQTKNITVEQLVEWQQLDLTEKLFLKGIKNLESQIRKHSPSINPDAIFAANPAAARIASYLDGCFKPSDGRPLCVFKTGPRVNDIDRKLCPCLPNAKLDTFLEGAAKHSFSSVLVVDTEYKKGTSGRQVIELLMREYSLSENQVYYAVLAACGIQLSGRAHGTSPETMENLLASSTHQPQVEAQKENRSFITPDFLAFVTRGSIEPPRESR